MHIHGNQLNPNIQLNALDAAERAAAQREAAETRRKLRAFAAKVAGESGYGEDCVVKLGTRQEPQYQTKQQNREAQNRGKDLKAGAAAGNEDKSVSEWA
jgi:hypothetical protein